VIFHEQRLEIVGKPLLTDAFGGGDEVDSLGQFLVLQNFSSLLN